MTLGERIARFKPDTMVYVGCVNGSSFILIDYRKNIIGSLKEKHMETLLDTEIKQGYRRKTNTPGAVLLIEGNTSGRYWFYEEQPGKGTTK